MTTHSNMNSGDSRPSLPSERDSSGRSLGAEELELLRQVIESGSLFSVPGTMVPQFETELSETFGVAHARAVSSGSAAVHTALGALDVAPGDEVITTPITDMGAISPILFQGAVPVFADVEPKGLNVTADTIRPRISERTGAIVVTHLFGNPCDMDPILSLCAEHGIPLVEDSAQAYLSTYKGRTVGSMGDMSTFSMHQVKHMTCGEGGFVLSNSDALSRRARVWADKGWNYDPDQPDHEFLGLNYRMSELQGAVALAQLRKLPGMVENRIRTGNMLCELISGIPGIEPPAATVDSVHTFWRFALHVDAKEAGVDPDELSSILLRDRVWSKPGYIRRPAFMCAQFTDKKTFANTWYPYSALPSDRPLEDPDDYPGCMAGLASVLVIPWTERYEEEHVRFMATAIEQAVRSSRPTIVPGGGL